VKVPGPIHLAYAAAVLRRRLGRNGPEVSLLGLGCNNFGQRVGLAETRDIVAAALDEGVTFFDTADLYGRTDSERYLGQALGPRRADVVIATKWGYTTLEGAPTRRGLGLRPKAVPRGSGRYIRWALDESLRRLGTDWIDVYQYHLLDEETPLEETFDALFEEIRAGKIRFVGLPTLDVPELEHAVATAERLGLPLASMQVHVNLIRRDAADTVLPAAERLGVGALPYLPLEGGLLTGKYRRDEPLPQDSRYASMPVHWPRERWLTDQAFDRAEALEQFAASHGLSLLEVALGGLAAMPAVASIIAGATRPEQVRANAKAVGWSPSPEELADLRAVV
jgi:aryl-alcohol dehydrogenase-like predicted oxidoreductase